MERPDDPGAGTIETLVADYLAGRQPRQHWTPRAHLTKEGYWVYLHNMMIIEQYGTRSAAPIAPGRRRIEVVTIIAGPGKAGRAELARTVPLAFTASETFDVGIDLGAPVAAAYAQRRPFAFNGTIHTVKVAMGGASATGLREP